jgi:rhodanese-related sulfurtransferase
MPPKREKTESKKMSIWLWVGIAAVVLLAAAAVYWMASPKGPPPLPAEISAEDAFAKRGAGAFILDVREPDEWNQFHIQGSTLIPLLQLKDRLDEVPRDKEVVVVCRSGNRSKQGRDILLEAGFKQVTSVQGGLGQWQAVGYPTITGP